MRAAFQDYRAGYAALWATMQIKPECQRHVTLAANRILLGKPHYQAVEKLTGVPWFIVGVIHYLESDCSFGTWLHNGDPMRDHAGHPIRTTHVPAGLPADPNVSWEEGARDALRVDSLDRVHDWTLEMMAYKLEAFNGYGYHGRGINSPYLWAMTNHYLKGMYIADHVYDQNKVSQECGAMALLAALAAMDGSVALAIGVKPKPAPVTPPVPLMPAWLAAILRWLSNWFSGWKGK